MEENVIKKRKTNRFAIFLTVLSFLCLLFTALVLFSTSLILLYYLILFLILMMTLFILILDKEFMALFDGGDETFSFIASLYQYIPYAAGISIGLSALSILTICLSKKTTNKTPMIVINSILIVIAIVILVVPKILKIEMV